MNYTKKSLSCKQNPQQIKKDITIESFSSSFSEAMKKKRGESRDSLSSPLGNREVGKLASKFSHIYKKYTRKQISQYALTVEVTEDYI